MKNKSSASFFLLMVLGLALQFSTLAHAETAGTYTCSVAGAGTNPVYQNLSYGCYIAPFGFMLNGTWIRGGGYTISQSCTVTPNSITQADTASREQFLTNGSLSCSDGRQISVCLPAEKTPTCTYNPPPPPKPVPQPIECYPNSSLTPLCKSIGDFNIPVCPCAGSSHGCIPIVPEGGTGSQIVWVPLNGASNPPGWGPLAACLPISAATSTATPVYAKPISGTTNTNNSSRY